MFLCLMSLFQYWHHTFNWIVKAVNLTIIFAIRLLPLLFCGDSLEGARVGERAIRSEGKEQTLTAAQIKLRLEMSERRPADKAAAKKSNGISNEQQPQTIPQAAAASPAAAVISIPVDPNRLLHHRPNEDADCQKARSSGLMCCLRTEYREGVRGQRQGRR